VVAKGVNSVTLSPASRADSTRYPKDSWVYLCTGPAFDDVDGRYFRVVSTDSNTGVVTFYENVRDEDFITGQTCLVPGPFVENLAIRNVKVGGIQFRGNASIVISGGVNLTLENVQMVAGDTDLIADGMGLVECQNVRIVNCFGDVEQGSGQNFSIEDSWLEGFVTHAFGRDFTLSRCRIDGPMRIWFGSYRYTFRDCEFDLSVSDPFYGSDSSDIVFSNCRIVTTGGTWGFNGPRMRMQDVRILAGSIDLGAQCTDCVLENVTMPSSSTITFGAGSTGHYSNLIPDPGPKTGWKTDRMLVMPEITDPSAPSANSAAIYTRDNGSGKSQLCVRFPTGAVQVIATEP
jgi:hypothetical protein